jgi:hypothetical protein
LAAQKLLATTATPLPVGTTFSTPGTLSAALGSNLASLAPNAGGRATTAVRSPGNWTSIPNCALPVIFSGVSSRRTLVPISFQSLGSLSWTVLGGASFIASSATLPNDSWSLPWLSTPLATRMLDAGTFQRAAAARTSMSRATAPTVR